jgi:glycine cleavage system H protein
LSIGVEELRYKRSRFTARLPMDRLYTPAHFWVRRDEATSVCTVGLTRFAKRMLGDIVEFDFDVKPGSRVEVGQVIGWIEAFKAVADLYCVANGSFVGPNAAVMADPSLIDKDPHGEGWLYAVTGTPDERAVDAHGYAAMLDAHIDKMLGDPGSSAVLDQADDQEDNCRV